MNAMSDASDEAAGPASPRPDKRRRSEGAPSVRRVTRTDWLRACAASGTGGAAIDCGAPLGPLLADSRICILGGRAGVPWSLGAVYAGSVLRFLGTMSLRSTPAAATCLGLYGSISGIGAAVGVAGRVKLVVLTAEAGALPCFGPVELVNVRSFDEGAGTVCVVPPPASRAQLLPNGGLLLTRTWMHPECNVWQVVCDDADGSVQQPLPVLGGCCFGLAATSSYVATLSVYHDTDAFVWDEDENGDTASERRHRRVAVFDRTADDAPMSQFASAEDLGGGVRNPHGGFVLVGPCFLPDGKHVAVGDRVSGCVHVYHVDGTLTRTITVCARDEMSDSRACLAFTAAGELLVLAQRGCRVFVVDADTGARLGVLTMDTDADDDYDCFEYICAGGDCVFAVTLFGTLVMWQ